MTLEEKVDDALASIRDEVLRAARKFPEFNSPHEGYAVLLEEVDELWDEVKANKGRSFDAHVEAIQVGAMAVRYMLDCGPRKDS